MNNNVFLLNLALYRNTGVIGSSFRRRNILPNSKKLFTGIVLILHIPGTVLHKFVWNGFYT
jgi:hypothetical protein